MDSFRAEWTTNMFKLCFCLNWHFQKCGYVVYFIFLYKAFGKSSHVVCLGVNIERVAIELPFLILSV